MEDYNIDQGEGILAWLKQKIKHSWISVQPCREEGIKNIEYKTQATKNSWWGWQWWTVIYLIHQ